MRLYPKKLHSTAELIIEKQLLQSRIGQIDPDGTFSLKPENNSKVAGRTAKKTENNLLGSLLGSGTAIDIFLKVLPMFTGGKRKEKEKTSEERKGPNILVKAGIEFVGGYLKWKAIELSYKGLKKLFSSNTDKKA